MKVTVNLLWIFVLSWGLRVVADPPDPTTSIGLDAAFFSGGLGNIALPEEVADPLAVPDPLAQFNYYTGESRNSLFDQEQYPKNIYTGTMTEETQIDAFSGYEMSAKQYDPYAFDERDKSVSSTTTDTSTEYRSLSNEFWVVRKNQPELVEPTLTVRGVVPRAP